jgi:hypothetical protein
MEARRPLAFTGIEPLGAPLEVKIRCRKSNGQQMHLPIRDLEPAARGRYRHMYNDTRPRARRHSMQIQPGGKVNISFYRSSPNLKGP